jgi:protein ImuA
VPPAALLHASPRHLKDALMIAEAALAVDSFAAVILEIYGNPQRLGLTESRRLHLRAKAHRRPIFLLREHGAEEASNAVNRFAVRPAAAAPYILPNGAAYAPGLGNPVFHVTIEKSRNPSPPEFLLEWNADDCLFRETDAGRIAVPAEWGPEDTGAVFPFPGDRPDRAEPLGPLVAFPRAS